MKFVFRFKRLHPRDYARWGPDRIGVWRSFGFGPLGLVYWEAKR